MPSRVKVLPAPPAIWVVHNVCREELALAAAHFDGPVQPITQVLPLTQFDPLEQLTQAPLRQCVPVPQLIGPVPVLVGASVTWSSEGQLVLRSLTQPTGEYAQLMGAAVGTV